MKKALLLGILAGLAVAAAVTQVPSPGKVGDIGSGGGYVFYDKGSYSNGWRYLEAAPENMEFTAAWSDAKTRCASLSVNGLTGWRLPDKDQLNLMYRNLKERRVGGFKNGIYWSSSEGGNYHAWTQDFNNGIQNNYNKDNTLSVRAIRVF